MINDAGLPATNAPPIFLQTGFRSCGTWLWSSFRVHPNVLAFCEPLNESLESLTVNMIADLRAETSCLKHPITKMPYFSEFLPLLNDNGIGIRHYKANFGIQNYFDMPQNTALELESYLNFLLDHANRCGRQPVLKFTRALGRACWLRAQFPQAKQILLLRSPLEQFQSGWDLYQVSNNLTFLMIPLFIVSLPETGPLRKLCEYFGIEHVAATEELAARTGAYAKMIRDMSHRVLLGAFLAMFIVAYATSAPQADLIIDSSTLRSPQDRQRLEQELYTLTGLHVDLSSYASPQSAVCSAPLATNIQETVDEVFALLQPSHAKAITMVRALLRT